MRVIDDYEFPPTVPEEPALISDTPPPVERSTPSKIVEDGDPYYSPVSPPPQDCCDDRATPDYTAVYQDPSLDEEEDILYHNGDVLPDDEFPQFSRKRRYSCSSLSSQ